ncbi:acyl-CoA thioesterase [Leptothoe sp. PORK10 BA2]|uniref:acyl-CoA thioesterase n=1 Tax=Leptothoe sp. PORK10 BA2 TaxID=3110254 RepID=UPI002B1E90DD|nr:thioesterase family protein [Leptothoe sp. PORK10 BA2]MEA5466333.1 thioesterase family protein [Leptothoe sp. PORK10 BA2]
MPNRWFNYSFRVQPHHTDYSGVVWHGTYIQWMEAARVECLRAVEFAFEDFVAAGYDLPVVDLQLRYHHPLTLGTEGLVKTRLDVDRGVKLKWLYEIYNITQEPPQLCITCTVVLVPIDMAKRKIARRLPAELQTMFDSLQQYFADESTI